MESMRIGCFECTGCLRTWLPNDIHDTKVRPQGMPQGSFTVPTHLRQHWMRSRDIWDKRKKMRRVRVRWNMKMI